MAPTVLDPRAVAVVVAASRVALCRESGTDTPSGAEPDWSAASPAAVLAAAQVHRVTPLLATVIRDLRAPEEIVDGILALERTSLLRTLHMVSEATRAASVMTQAGVPFLQYKGIPLAVQSTGSLTSRGSGDIDLLVLPHDLPRAHEALSGAGWAGAPLSEDRPWWPWYLRMRRERTYRGELSSVDLHWRVSWHDQPLPGTATLLARAEPVAVGGAQLPSLSLPDAFAVACYSATMDRFARIRSLVDIVRLTRLPGIGLPAGSPWRLRRLVGEAVAFADELIGGVPSDRRHQFAPAGSVDTARVRRIWDQTSVGPLWTSADPNLAGMLAIYREPVRYAGVAEAALMALSDGLLPPERLREARSAADVPRLVGAEVVDLLRTRVLRRR